MEGIQYYSNEMGYQGRGKIGGNAALALATDYVINAKLSDRTNNPFELKSEEVSFHVLSQNIEIDLLQQRDDNNFPKPLRPVDGVLL